MATWVDICAQLPPPNELADPSLRVVAAAGLPLMRLQSEGLVGYLLSPDAVYASDTIVAFERIGAASLAGWLRKLVDALGGVTHSGRITREQVIELVDSAAFREVEAKIDELSPEAVSLLEDHIDQAGVDRDVYSTHGPRYQLRLEDGSTVLQPRGEAMAMWEADLIGVSEVLETRLFEAWNGEVGESDLDLPVDQLLEVPMKWFQAEPAKSEFSRLSSHLIEHPGLVGDQGELIEELRIVGDALRLAEERGVRWHLFVES